MRNRGQQLLEGQTHWEQAFVLHGGVLEQAQRALSVLKTRNMTQHTQCNESMQRHNDARQYHMHSTDALTFPIGTSTSGASRALGSRSAQRMSSACTAHTLLRWNLMSSTDFTRTMPSTLSSGTAKPRNMHYGNYDQHDAYGYANFQQRTARQHHANNSPPSL